MQYGVVSFETTKHQERKSDVPSKLLFSPCINHRGSIERNRNYASIVALLVGSVEEETSSHAIRTFPKVFLYGHDQACEVLSGRQCQVIVLAACNRYKHPAPSYQLAQSACNYRTLPSSSLPYWDHWALSRTSSNPVHTSHPESSSLISSYSPTNAYFF